MTRSLTFVDYFGEAFVLCFMCSPAFLLQRTPSQSSKICTFCEHGANNCKFNYQSTHSNKCQKKWDALLSERQISGWQRVAPLASDSCRRGQLWTCFRCFTSVIKAVRESRRSEECLSSCETPPSTTTTKLSERFMVGVLSHEHASKRYWTPP